MRLFINLTPLIPLSSPKRSLGFAQAGLSFEGEGEWFFNKRGFAPLKLPTRYFDGFAL